MSSQDAGTTSREEFGGNQLEVIAETASTAVAAQARAQVEAQYIMALKRPRDMDQVRLRLMKECKRPGFAAVAKYALPRAGKLISGPSVRFAEAAIMCMSNIAPTYSTIWDDRTKRIVKISVTDLERNIPYAMEIVIDKTVERKSPGDSEVIGQRTNKRGDLVYIVAANEGDLVTKQAAMQSKALRTLALKLIPGDLIDEAMWEIQNTLTSEDKSDPEASRKRMVDGFAKVGVEPQHLKEYLGHDLGQSTPTEIDELRGIYAALNTGEATWKSIMDAKKGDAPATDAPGKGSAGLRAALDKKRPPAPPKDKAPARTIDPDEGDGPPENDESIQ